MSNNNKNNNLNFKTLPLNNNQKLNVSKIPQEIGLFIDNDQGYIDDVKKCGQFMDVLKVGGMTGEVPYMSWEDPRVKPFITALTGNQMLLRMLKEKRGVPYDPESGVTKDHSDFIERWVNDKRKKGYRTISVLFDYDRTLTVVEGTDLSKLDEFDSETFIEYHLGGKQRVAMLRDLFTFLYNQGVNLYVLTNNTACNDYRYTRRFHQVVYYIFNPYPVGIICGQEWKGHKDQAASTVLPSICPLGVKAVPYEKNNTGVMYTNNKKNNENTSEETINKKLQALGLKGGKRKTRRSKKHKRKQRTRRN